MLQQRLEMQMGKLLVENHALAEKIEELEAKLKKIEDEKAKE